MRKYFANLKLGFLRYQQYPIEFFFVLLKRVIQIFFMVVLWDIIAEDDPSGTLVALVSYYLAYNAVSDFIMVQSFNLGNTLAKMIHTGELNNLLIKPIKPPVYAYFKIFGTHIPLVMVSLTALSFLIARGDIVPSNALVILLYLVIGIIIGIGLNMILASFAFYVTKIFGIREVFKFFMRILSGSFIPIFFMPDTFVRVLDLSFVSYVGYKPVLLILGQIEGTLFDVAIGVLWMIIISLFAILFWRKANEKYEAYGI
jgi:ABC-2 type transport system permease protein